MVIKHTLTPDIARELFDYNPETGVITWKPREQKGFLYKDFHIHWNARWAGKTAGTLSCGRYLVCNVLNRLNFAHRIAWMVYYGDEPPEVIDHINGDGTDNRITNLRAANSRINAENRRLRSAKKVLPLGVFPVANSKSGKVFARIIINKRRMYLGSFDDPKEAHLAYLAAKRKYHEGCSI